MNKNNIITLIRNSLNVRSEVIEQTQKYWLIKVYGEYKDMNKAEVGFSNKQLEQLKNLIVEIVPPMVRSIIKEEVPPMVRSIIKEEVPPMVRTIIKEEVPPMIDQKLEPILNCPTIKKELAQ